MLFKLNKKPEGLFNNQPDDLMWIEMFDINGTYGYMGLGSVGDAATVHVEITRWVPSVAKSAAEDWKEVKCEVAVVGKKRIIASYDGNEEEKWKKFIKLFGFGRPRAVLIAEQEV